ncbi:MULTISPECIES: transcriptional regulator [Pseudomonas]|uniref:transcriptional regulator n=1 Tax=Pseudomonas TaxID=286 RepID=UPI0017827EEE|nr:MULTISPECIES: transcriptional regulator [unclassified Pseudomonas]MBD8709794.1 transcriptional regulator [Pseudomonas sp. CFBP 13711]MBD8711400.1 transcriptional regulator [Pseudomonas sp. CFBP 13715]
MSKRYDWDLIERLLHHVQNSVAIADASEASAAELRALLLERGFIAAHTSGDGGNGEGATLTPRGASLLAMIDSSIPGNDHPRQVLDEQADALDKATFDEVASKAQIA